MHRRRVQLKQQLLAVTRVTTYIRIGSVPIPSYPEMRPRPLCVELAIRNAPMTNELVSVSAEFADRARVSESAIS